MNLRLRLTLSNQKHIIKYIIKIYGTKAEVVCKMEDNCFEIRYFGGETEKVVVDISAATVGGHNGSDYFMMNDLFDILNNEQAENVSYLDVSLESHLICFAAEESRLKNGTTITINKK